MYCLHDNALLSSNWKAKNITLSLNKLKKKKSNLISGNGAIWHSPTQPTKRVRRILHTL